MLKINVHSCKFLIYTIYFISCPASYINKWHRKW